MSREDATAVLGKEPPGSFLIRESTNVAGDFSISFKVPAGVKHFKVGPPRAAESMQRTRCDSVAHQDLANIYLPPGNGLICCAIRRRFHAEMTRAVAPALTVAQIIAHEFGDFFIADNRFSTLHALVEYYYNTFLCDNMCLQIPVKPAAPVSVRAAAPCAFAQRAQAQSVSRQVVVALYEYASMGPNELRSLPAPPAPRLTAPRSFQAGDRFTVLNDADSNWLWVNAHGSGDDGFVPRTFVEVAVSGWCATCPPPTVAEPGAVARAAAVGTRAEPVGDFAMHCGTDCGRTAGCTARSRASRRRPC